MQTAGASARTEAGGAGARSRLRHRADVALHRRPGHHPDAELLGRYPHWGATLLLLPLVAIGLFWSPSAIWRAFVKGRGEMSLYRPELRDAAAGLQLDALMERTRAKRRSNRVADVAAFAWLVLQSASIIVAPIAVLVIATFE
jgi:hypothetical protein